MKVKVGEQLFDSGEVPVMLVLGTADKQNIQNMPPDVHKFLSYPEGSMSEGEIREFMEIPPSRHMFKKSEQVSAGDDKVVVHHEQWNSAASIGDFVAVIERYDEETHIQLRKRDEFGRLVELPDTPLTKQDALNLAELLVAAVK